MQKDAAIDPETGLPMTPQDTLVLAWMEINSPNVPTPVGKTTVSQAAESTPTSK